MASSDDQESDAVYQQTDAIADATKTSLIMGAAGVATGAIRNTLARENMGTLGAFRQTGATTVMFLAIGGTFGFLRSASANLREKNDYWNPTLAGFFAGSMAGIQFRSFPAVLGTGAVMAAGQYLIGKSGGKISGFSKEYSHDEEARKQQLRDDKRRPVEETIAQLGEFRGVPGLQGPTYRERRAQRLKDSYGIDVPNN